jgi:hypothetical protein
MPEPLHRLLDSLSTRPALRTLAVPLVAVLLAMTTPTDARAEACNGVSRLVKAERATEPIAVVTGRSIGPISTGMSRRPIIRVAGRGAYIRSRGAYRFKVHGLPVYVTFGHWGKARSLTANSGRLTIDGAPLSAGPDTRVAMLPGAQRSDCASASPDGYITFFIPQGCRQTTVSFFHQPTLPQVVIVNAAMRPARRH